jgi:uncharacterized phiE125 gp8 family phage protein
MGAADNRWKVTTDPIELPITLADAKDFLRVDHSDEDDIITSAIGAAVDYCEAELGLALMDQTVTVKLDGFPAEDYIRLPMSNLLSVVSVSYTDQSGDSQTYTDYTADTFNTPGRIVNNLLVWPQTKDVANSVTIVYRAGFKEYNTGMVDPVPRGVRQAMMMLITHYYDNRNTVFVGAGLVSDEVAMAVTSLLAKFRRMSV